MESGRSASSALSSLSSASFHSKVARQGRWARKRNCASLPGHFFKTAERPSALFSSVRLCNTGYFPLTLLSHVLCVWNNLQEWFAKVKNVRKRSSLHSPHNMGSRDKPLASLAMKCSYAAVSAQPSMPYSISLTRAKLHCGKGRCSNSHTSPKHRPPKHHPASPLTVCDPDPHARPHTLRSQTYVLLCLHVAHTRMNTRTHATVRDQYGTDSTTIQPGWREACHDLRYILPSARGRKSQQSLLWHCLHAPTSNRSFCPRHDRGVVATKSRVAACCPGMSARRQGKLWSSWGIHLRPPTLKWFKCIRICIYA